MERLCVKAKLGGYMGRLCEKINKEALLKRLSRKAVLKG